MWKQRRIPVIGALAIASGVLPGCDPADVVSGIGNVDNTDFVASETFQFTLDVTTQGQFRLDGINGNVQVTGVQGATVLTVSGERRVGSSSTADARAHLPSLRVEIDEGSSTIVVRTVQPEDSQGRNYVVNYVVAVPSDMRQSIANVNGNITVSGIDANTAISNINGNIATFGLVGNLSIGLVNGTIDADVTLPPSGDVALASVNGNISLRVPVDVSAELEANWVNGSFSVLNLVLQDQVITESSARGRLGDGDGTINMGLTNGVIAVIGR
jgi:DUF4097 and DUF4098 domain-containing protein YvlB